MKESIGSVFLTLVLFTSLLSACAPASTPIPATSIPEPTATLLPSPTPLPGSESLPLDTFGTSIPWLPLENTARPGSEFFLFNLSKPPFTNMLVRQAFAAAIDREAIVRIALENGVINPRAATTLTPPETLGRDLFNAVGVPFHPATGRQLLSQAGYTDLSNFPPVTLMTLPGRDSFQIKIAEEMVRMWKIYLDITVNLEVVSEKYFDRAGTDPTEIFWVAQAADYNDPDDFLLEIFHTGSQLNINHFSNAAFDELVELAAATSDPAARQELYIQAERILCEQEVALIPLYHVTYNIP